MKVEVIYSAKLSRIVAGMIGEANCSPVEWSYGAPNFSMEVQFEDVPFSVPGDNRRGSVIVMMQKQELKPYGT